MNYDERVQAAAKGLGLSEAANSIISTAYRGQKTVQSLYLNTRGQVVTSPQTGAMPTRPTGHPSNEATEMRNSHAFSFPSVEAGKQSEKPLPLSKKNSTHRKTNSRGDFAVGAVAMSGLNQHKTIDPTRSQLGSLPGLRTGPPGTAGSKQRPTNFGATEHQAGADLTASVANASSEHPSTVKPPHSMPFNSTRPHHSRPAALVQNTERSSKFEPLNF